MQVNDCLFYARVDKRAMNGIHWLARHPSWKFMAIRRSGAFPIDSNHHALADAGLDFVYKAAHGRAPRNRIGFPEDAL